MWSLWTFLLSIWKNFVYIFCFHFKFRLLLVAIFKKSFCCVKRRAFQADLFVSLTIFFSVENFCSYAVKMVFVSALKWWFLSPFNAEYKQFVSFVFFRFTSVHCLAQKWTKHFFQEKPINIFHLWFCSLVIRKHYLRKENSQKFMFSMKY